MLQDFFFIPVEVTDQPDMRGRTALMWASAAAGACDMMKAMCRHGADLAHQVRSSRKQLLAVIAVQ